MALSESDRLEMHLGLRKALGVDVADKVMEHLPPSGWGDVARRHDIEALGRRVDALKRRIGVAISGALTFGLAMIALQVQIMLTL